MESSLLQKEINSLTDEDPKLRKKALLKLYAAIVIPETPLPPCMSDLSCRDGIGASPEALEAALETVG